MAPWPPSGFASVCRDSDQHVHKYSLQGAVLRDFAAVTWTANLTHFYENDELGSFL